MEPLRSALYLDFDNVFSGLARSDPNLAVFFAEAPDYWLARMAAGFQGQPRRRWLVLRCYMNPAGWIPHPENDGARLYFSRFRPFLTDAGFEVVDCPRLSHTKNGADIRLVIDAVEALRADVVYEEFVIASGDSDMTPLMVRLRAADRRTTLLSPSDSAVALAAVADRLVGGEELLELLDRPADELVEGLDDGDPAAAVNEPVSPSGEPDAKARFTELVAQRYQQAAEPLNIATLAHEVRRELGPVVATTKWFGYDGFVRALQAQDLPGVRMSHTLLWDSTRHTTPETSAPTLRPSPELPEPVASLTKGLRLPALPAESWSSIHEGLASFLSAYEFNLGEATRWVRDRLVDRGARVSRQAVGIVARGASFGGCPLYRQPPPRADEIATAFVDNLLKRAVAADIDLAPSESDQVRAWFGAV